jgi:hypothetical protein
MSDIMKILLLIITSFLFSVPEKADVEIYGKWKLQKIEIDEKIIYPKEREYFLKITSGRIKYNLEINTCGTEEVTITPTAILYSYTACTKICCDGSDPITNHIKYSGFYEVKDALLTIENDKGKMFLIKQPE